jgi:tetratricopeptide (TPR) repeat protein/predicted aspartyl protease
MSTAPFRVLLSRLAAGLALAGLALACDPAWAKCELGRVADLPVTLLGGRALLPAKINGHDVQFVVDSGASYSFISPANADKFKLPLRPLPWSISVTSNNGDIDAAVGDVDVLTLADKPIRHIDFIVGGGEAGAGSAGLIGQNVLGQWDVEYDLAKGAIRLWAPKGCSDRDNMVYWSATIPYSVIDIAHGDGRLDNQTKGKVYVNGVRLTAIFDTGADRSVMTRAAAARAGIRPNDPGVVAAGYTVGAGRRILHTWIAPIRSFKIGGEEAHNTKILFSEIEPTGADMLIGMDFFLAHHVFVANGQHKLYVTYNGGPVFNLDQTPLRIVVPASLTSTPGTVAPPVPAETALGSLPTDSSDVLPTDAAGFARRGAAYAARNELAPALADLSKAIELAPAVPAYHYQRGLFYERNRQPFLAMSDFDETLKLKPDDVPALVARAALYLAGHETAQALQDLAAADKTAAKQDDIHLEIANLYARADAPSAAINQYSLWIDAHSEDARLANALNGRCWQRALLGVDLDKALNDCDRAIRNAPKTANMLDSRGLVHLRLGEFDKAIADYDASLAINPKIGWSLYGRGLAKQRKGLTAEGAADIAAATAINPRLPDEVKAHGLTP